MPPGFDELKRRLVATVDQTVPDGPVRALKRDLDCLIPEPLDLDDLDRHAGDQAADQRAWRQLLKTHLWANPLSYRPQLSVEHPGIKHRQ
jgi:hypothetical protein